MPDQADSPNAPRKAGIVRIIWRVIRIPVFVYVGLVLLVFCFQGCLVFRPSKELEHTPADALLKYESVDLKTDDGLRIHAWYVPADNARGVILFCHGNAGNISHRVFTLGMYNRLGFSTLIFDYRGYGRSEGRPSEKGTYRDAEAAWRHLVHDREIDPRRIILHGRSLGGSVAAYLATKHQARAVILESSFTSVPDFGAHHYWFLPVRLLARIRFDTLQCMPQIHCPVLVIHGKRDEIVPYKHGRRLFEAANDPKEFLEIPGTHNEGFSTTRYQTGLAAYLDRCAPPSTQPSTREGPTTGPGGDGGL